MHVGIGALGVVFVIGFGLGCAGTIWHTLLLSKVETRLKAIEERVHAALTVRD